MTAAARASKCSGRENRKRLVSALIRLISAESSRTGQKKKRKGGNDAGASRQRQTHTCLMVMKLRVEKAKSPTATSGFHFSSVCRAEGSEMILITGDIMSEVVNYFKNTTDANTSWNYSYCELIMNTS